MILRCYSISILPQPKYLNFLINWLDFNVGMIFFKKHCLWQGIWKQMIIKVLPTPYLTAVVSVLLVYFSVIKHRNWLPRDVAYSTSLKILKISLCVILGNLFKLSLLEQWVELDSLERPFPAPTTLWLIL